MVCLLKKEDIVDIIAEAVASLAHENQAGGAVVARVFVSDWELRRLRKGGARFIEVPKSAIISPLAKDWIDYEGIEIIYKQP